MTRAPLAGFEAQLSQAEPIILSVARRFEGGAIRCGLRVDDLAQESRLALLKAARKFDPRKGIWVTFVWAVCFRRCHELTRRDFKEIEFSGHDSTVDDCDHPEPPSEQTIQCLHRAIAELPPRQRIFVSKYFGIGGPKQSMEKIAKRHRFTRLTVWREIRIALAQMKQTSGHSLITR